MVSTGLDAQISPQQSIFFKNTKNAFKKNKKKYQNIKILHDIYSLHHQQYIGINNLIVLGFIWALQVRTHKSVHDKVFSKTRKMQFFFPKNYQNIKILNDIYSLHHKQYIGTNDLTVLGFNWALQVQTDRQTNDKTMTILFG